MTDKQHLYQQVEKYAEVLMQSGITYRRAFGYRLQQIADAIHDIEFVDQGMLSPGDEEEVVRAVTEPVECLIAAMETAKQVIQILQHELEKAWEFFDDREKEE